MAARATLTALPVELIHRILDALVSLPAQTPFRLAHTLRSVSLAHRVLTVPAQARLFRHPVLVGPAQAATFAALLRAGTLGPVVRAITLDAAADADAAVANPGADRALTDVASLAPLCPRLTQLEVLGTGVDVQPMTLGRLAQVLTTLVLCDVTLHSNLRLPALLSLSLFNVQVSVPDPDAAIALHLPALTTLSLSYSVTARSTSLVPLASLASTGAHLTSLTVGRLSTFMSDLLAASRAPRPDPPTLAPFTALASLSLLADSSYHPRSDTAASFGGGFFPLLATLPPASTLHTLVVRTELGYRDKVQEVEGMALELTDRLAAEQLTQLGTLRLSGVFRPFAELDVLAPLLETARRRRVVVEYSDD